MSDTSFIRKELSTLQNVKYWRFAIWKFYNGTIITIAGAAPAILIAWTNMSWPERLVSLIGAVVSLHKYWDGFLDQTVSRLAAGKPIVPINGNGNGHGHGPEQALSAEPSKPPTTS